MVQKSYPIHTNLTLKNLKLLRNAFDDAKNEIERNIGADEIKQDIHNEIRLKELEDNEKDSS